MPKDRFVYYTDWDESYAICPSCHRAGNLTPIDEPGAPRHIELGVVWFHCECGMMFKLGGIYKRIRLEKADA